MFKQHGYIIGPSFPSSRIKLPIKKGSHLTQYGVGYHYLMRRPFLFKDQVTRVVRSAGIQGQAALMPNVLEYFIRLGDFLRYLTSTISFPL